MIPEQWHRDWAALEIRRRVQSQKNYVLREGEERITEAHFKALDQKPVTRTELAALKKGKNTRGQYRRGDRRGFVIAHEEACARYNCWMVRKKGSVRYLSEEP